MKKDNGVNWGHLGRIEKSFLGLVGIWVVLYFAGAAGSFQMHTDLESSFFKETTIGT